MQILHYAKSAARLGKLHDALLAAGITPATVQGQGADLWITVADSQAPAAVAAVVAAYDPTTPSPGEQQQAQEAADLGGLRTALTTALAALAQDQQTLTADATTLGGSPTAAQVTAIVGHLGAIQARALTRQEAALRALGALVRRAGS